MTATYNYLDAVMDDVRNAIAENIDLDEWRGNRDGLEEKLNEDLWIDDSVTGNASGSYTMSTYKAEENLCHNMELIEEVAHEFGLEPVIKAGWEYGPEWWDVTIRCYYLGEAIAAILDELEEAGELDELEENEE